VPRPDVALVAPYPRAGARHEGASGVASYTANLAWALAGGGAAVTVVAPLEDGQPRAHRDGPVRVERAFRRGAGAVPAALAAAAATSAPVTHLQHELFLYGGPSSVPGLVAGLARDRRRGRRTVVTLHHVVDPARVDRAFTRLHRVAAPPLLARAGLAGVQRAVAALAADVVVHEPAFAVSVPGARVVPHGIEVAGAGPSPAAARARLGWGDDGPVVLCFGYLAPYKGLEVALEAAALLRGRVTLVVAGGAHPRLAAAGDPYADDLRARHGTVARFPGRVPEADVPAVHAAADLALFLYPQAFSASGALALALAHGTPFLLSPELAHTLGAPAELAVARDPAAVAARIGRLVGAPDELERVRLACRRLAEGRSWPTVAGLHLALYSGLDDADRPARRRLRAA